MTNHLRAIDIKEYAKALDVAKEFADRAEKAEAALQRVREVHQAVVDDEDDPWQVAYATGWDEALQEVRRALDGDGDE